MAKKAEKVTFRRGPSATMPQERVSGTLLIENDTGNAFVDDTDETRVQLTDTRKLSREGDTLNPGAKLSLSTEDESVSAEQAGDKFSFTDGQNRQVEFGINGIEGSPEVLSDIVKQVGFVWEAL